jgi:predicted secreted protein
MIIHLAESNNNQTISASMGDQIIVALECRATGYLWQEADTTIGTLEQVQQEAKKDGTDYLPGAPVTVCFQFKVERAGVIRFNYARPWEKEPIKLFQVAVNLK